MLTLMITKLIIQFLNNKEISNHFVTSSESLGFFKKHPNAISIFLRHFHDQLAIIFAELVKQGIVNDRGHPYNQGMISRYRNFLRDLIVYIDHNTKGTTNELTFK